jgi:DNA polymerase III subunit delta
MSDSPLDALKFLERPPECTGPLVAVFGPDAYLKREVLRGIRRVLSPGGDEPAEHRLEGREATLAAVLDELSTVSLFGDELRLVILEDADTFVTEHRAALERYVARPASRGVLVLEVKTWSSTTKLAKATAAAGGLAVRCDPPKPAQLRTWLTRRAKSLGVTLRDEPLGLLLDLVPPELGILQQEVDKLAACVGQGGEITAEIVQQNVGGGRVRQTWDMIDAAARGDAADALAQLDRLLGAGEDPTGLLPQFAGVLRRLVIAGRLVEMAERDGRRANLRAALQEAGVVHFKLADAERQLRQLGRERIGRLLRWLLEADLALKGSHSQRDAARRTIERLIVRLSKAADDRHGGTGARKRAN